MGKIVTLGFSMATAIMFVIPILISTGNAEILDDSRVYSRVARSCKSVWDNSCTRNSECCSGICSKGHANWASGVCRPGTKETSKPQNSNSNSNSHSRSSVSITFSEFRDAVTANRYKSPSFSQYNSFIKGLPKGKINSKQEAAMALAQILHESGGLQFKSELACGSTGSNPGCREVYPDRSCDAPGKQYFGRGYIQLTWCANYRAASADLGLGNQLVRHPEKVANDENLAWATAFWYWGKNVHSRQGVQQGQFGASTRAINGAHECTGKNLEQSRNRFQIYSKIFRIFKLAGSPNPVGCY